MKDSQSAVNLFNLLGRYESCSGLKINETESEMLWLGSWRHRKEKILNLLLSDVPIYALGVHFTYDCEVALKKNFWDKIISLKKL